MLRRILAFAILVVTLPLARHAQMTYRLKGTVKDSDGKPVSGARVRADALTGFRGEQFVGQKRVRPAARRDRQLVRWGLPLAVRRTAMGAAVKDLQGITAVKN